MTLWHVLETTQAIFSAGIMLGCFFCIHAGMEHWRKDEMRQARRDYAIAFVLFGIGLPGIVDVLLSMHG